MVCSSGVGTPARTFPPPPAFRSTMTPALSSWLVRLAGAYLAVGAVFAPLWAFRLVNRARA